MFHRLLLFLHIRNEFDWVPPGLGPEVNHPYYECAVQRCCDHCGGGQHHAIHSKPYNERRAAEVYRIEAAKLTEAEKAMLASLANSHASPYAGDPNVSGDMISGLLASPEAYKSYSDEYWKRQAAALPASGSGPITSPFSDDRGY